MQWYRCCKCDRYKPETCFYSNHRGDGDVCKECSKQYAKQYYQTNKEQCREYGKKYRNSHKEYYKKYSRKYDKNYKKTHKEYYKEIIKKFQQTPKGKAARKKMDAKRRKLGFVPLNEPFKDSHAHHIDNEKVVYIPAKIHKRFIGGKDTKRHRKLILQYYGSVEKMIANARQLTLSNL